MVDVVGTPRHVRHHKGGGDGKDRTALIQTNAATQELLFDRGLCIAEERIAPWKRLRKQCGTLLVEFLKPVFGIGAIREKTGILGLGQGQTDRQWHGRMRYSVMPSSMYEDVVRDSSLTSRNRGRHATPLQTINRIRYNQKILNQPPRL